MRKALADLDEELYEDIELTIAYSSADQIINSVNNVETNLFLAVVIAMLVIFIFLGNFRSTIIIGVAIPLSIISTFVMLYFGGHTLNMVTLAALALIPAHKFLKPAVKPLLEPRHSLWFIIFTIFIQYQ